MLFAKTWERHFVKNFFKVFFLFILSFYALYILIDYTSHASGAHHNHSQFHLIQLLFFYLLEFIKRVEILLPFAILIATVKTLTQLNRDNELIALLSGGLRIKTLLTPFILIGLLFTSTLYLNTELLLPSALNKIKEIHDSYDSPKNNTYTHSVPKKVELNDGSLLLFQHFDSVKQETFDAFWILSIDDVWRIKTLTPFSDPPQGTWVDHLTRTKEGQLTLKESFPTYAFQTMHIGKKTFFEATHSPENWPLSQLWKKTSIKNPQNERAASQLSSLYRKLALPWLCLLAVIAPAPFCLRFEKKLSTFLIYTFAIFGLVACYLFLDAGYILGKRQVLSPFIAIWAPFLLFFSFFSWKYYKLQ